MCVCVHVYTICTCMQEVYCIQKTFLSTDDHDDDNIPAVACFSTRLTSAFYAAPADDPGLAADGQVEPAV